MALLVNAYLMGGNVPAICRVFSHKPTAKRWIGKGWIWIG